MDTLKIKGNTRTLAVEWQNGKKKEYTVDVSSREKLKQWLEQEQKLGTLKGLNGDKLDGEAVDTVFEVCSGLVYNVFNRKDADDIMRRSGGNFIVLIQIIVKAADLANSSLAEGLASVKSFVKTSD